MIHVIATIQIHAGKRAQFLEEFHRLVPSVQAEDGCIEYGPTIDIASGLQRQISMRDDVVTVIEKWRDLPALHAHLAAPHMTDFRTRVKDLVLGTDLQILTPA